jgi:hypothetical protein
MTALKNDIFCQRYIGENKLIVKSVGGPKGGTGIMGYLIYGSWAIPVTYPPGSITLLLIMFNTL